MTSYESGLWIRIHFFADPNQDPAAFLNAKHDPAAILMQIQIQFNKRRWFKITLTILIGSTALVEIRRQYHLSAI